MNLDTLATYHHILEKVFKHLEPRDIYNCEIVFPLWREHGQQWRQKCPAIRVCALVESSACGNADLPLVGDEELAPDSSVLRKNEWTHVFERMKKEVDKEMDDQPDAVLHHHYFAYRHLNTGDGYRYSPNFNVNQPVRQLFSDSLFAFLVNNDELLPHIDVDCPYVEIISPDLGIDLLRVPRISTFSENQRPYTYSFYLKKLFHGFKIDRYATETKIFLIDWNSEESIDSDIDDPNFPIKCLINFVDNWNLADYLPLKSFLEKRENIASSYVLLQEYSELSFKNRGSEKLKSSSCLSIAFAGEAVKSATLYIENLFDLEDVSKKLRDFRQSIHFPVNDQRLIGFFLYRYSSCEDWTQMYSLVKEFFPLTNFSQIECNDRHRITFGSEDFLSEGLEIHLIRI